MRQENTLAKLCVNISRGACCQARARSWGGSAFGATAHDDVHDAFMTLPAYTRTREGEVHQLGSGPNVVRASLCIMKCSLM